MGGAAVGMDSRAWCFTINNYTDEDWSQVNAMYEDAVYACDAPEVGEQGTPHIQGFVYFKNAKTMKRVSKYIRRAFLKVASGTAAENRVYIFGPYSKGEKFKELNPLAREFGEMPVQGKRSDISNIKEKIQAGENKISVLIEEATSFQSVRFAECYLKYKEQKRDWLPEVKWYWGDPRSGKTRLAHEELHDPYVSIHGKWFEGYDAHENVIIDDLRREYVVNCGGFGAFMNRLDRYAHQVECKGSTRQFLAKKIIITTIYEPRAFMLSFFPNEPYEQLLGRLAEIKEFQRIKEKGLKE